MAHKSIAAVLAALVLCTSLSGCHRAPSSSGTDSVTVLTIGTADSGGTMYPVGTAIAQVLSNDTLKINVGASTGSSMNIQTLADGAVDLALVSGDAAHEAYHLDSSAPDLRAVAAVFTSLSNWLVDTSVSQDIRYVHDLKGLRVGVGPENSTTERAARIVIESFDLNRSDTTLVNCALGAGSEMVVSGKLDAIHGFSGIPIGGLSNLANTVPCRVLEYTPAELSALLEANPIYFSSVIPAGTYAGQSEDVQTFGVKCLLCVDASMDEELVYTITKRLWENRELLSQAHPSMSAMKTDAYLFGDLPIPLHPGAERLYAEVSQ